MATMNVSLPDQMREWVDEQTRSGRYGNASDYVRDLIRHDQERAAKIANMQKLVDEAIASRVCDLTFEEIRNKGKGPGEVARQRPIGADRPPRFASFRVRAAEPGIQIASLSGQILICSVATLDSGFRCAAPERRRLCQRPQAPTVDTP